MENIKYIMVTNWARHWDDLESRWGNSTLFTERIIKDGLAKGPWPDEAITLFIKKTAEGNSFEKSWIGKTKNFKKDPNKGNPAIRFEVLDLQICECPEQYKKLINGWHLNKSNPSALVSTKGNQMPNENLQPAFFNEMGTCSWEQFEKHCYHLLRLLGIHDIHALPREMQQGKADGFFRFHNSLSVIYDATLETDYRVKKAQQIENYINQLKKEKIEFNSNSYTIKDTQRQVWIITRGSKTAVLKMEDNIKVKEVPYKKLIEVYNRRLTEEIGVDALWDILKDLN